MYLFGASGHAKVIIEILEQQGIEIQGLFDDNHEIESLLDYPVIPYTEDILKKSKLIVAIGNNLIRKTIKERLNVDYGLAIHPTATISKRSSIGEGTVIMGHAIINSSTIIGKHCIINTSSSIDHDCIIGDYVHISPNATITGNVIIEEGAWIGAGAVILPGIKIGNWSMVGAGAVVTKDVSGNCTVMGIPAKKG